jgi:hypothetical protein
MRCAWGCRRGLIRVGTHRYATASPQRYSQWHKYRETTYVFLRTDLCHDKDEADRVVEVRIARARVEPVVVKWLCSQHIRTKHCNMQEHDATYKNTMKHARTRCNMQTTRCNMQITRCNMLYTAYNEHGGQGIRHTRSAGGRVHGLPHNHRNTEQAAADVVQTGARIVA